MNQTIKKYKINFENSIEKIQDSNINTVNPKKLNKNIYQMTKDVESLDRFDDFSKLKISLDSYEKLDGSFYGITKDYVHNNSKSVILPHQEQAALQFLRDLRGFGLLADVVGSGKTYEAGVVLSELAIRGMVNSLLVIVPLQVFDTWVEVLENKFGLGKDVLLKLDDEFSLDDIELDQTNRPLRPMIVTAESFSKWNPNSIKNILFDVVIVDEAHHLCDDKGQLKESMYLLSLLMQTKKKANSTYCLLLSATPHSGNLDKMYRLWYFVRCKGGDPMDFKTDANNTAQYNLEHQHYFKDVCHNSKTVIEFINNRRYEILQNNPKFLGYCDLFGYDLSNLAYSTKLRYASEFMNSSIRITKKETILKVIDDPELAELEKDARVNLDNLVKADDIRNVSVFRELALVERYVNKKFKLTEKEKEQIIKDIANSYHNGVLRSIMIRQPNGEMLGKKKNITNYFFFPTNKDVDTTIEISKSAFEQYDLSDDLLVSVKDMFNDECITYKNKKMSISTLVNDYIETDYEKQAVYADIVNEVLTRFDNIDDNDNYNYSFNHKTPNNIFYKGDSLEYYHMQFEDNNDLQTSNLIMPIKYNENDLISHKYDLLVELLEKHNDERVLLFFDYDSSKTYIYNNEEMTMIDIVFDKLSNDDRFKSRIIEGTDIDIDNKIRQFDDNQNSILFIKTASFTEGANLQNSRVIINFEVPVDPISMDQRIGRIFRIGQKSDVNIYSLANMNDLEGYALAYFMRIGLMSSNNGDATIIAGSNNDSMIALRCPNCQSAKLYSKEEYDSIKDKCICDNPECQAELKKKIDSDANYLNNNLHKTITLVDGTYSYMLHQMSMYNFKCSNDSCKAVLTRSKDARSYVCLAKDKKVLCNTGNAEDRTLYCRKICMISHCPTFNKKNPKCQAIRAFNQNKHISDTEIFNICMYCETRCESSCMPMGDGFTASYDCINCEHNSKSKCNPRPQFIRFDENWQAKCPKCDNGDLLPITSHSFASYIRAIWDFNKDDGKSFVKQLLNESNKVSEIKAILSSDEMSI